MAPYLDLDLAIRSSEGVSVSLWLSLTNSLPKAYRNTHTLKWILHPSKSSILQKTCAESAESTVKYWEKFVYSPFKLVQAS